MGSLAYIRLIGYTAGTLLQLFWMVVILGYRRQRNFERVFFFLCLALFFFYGGSLLALNAQIYYVVPPPALLSFAAALLYVGLLLLPPLVVHLHLEYAETRGMVASKQAKRILIAAVYVPIVVFALRVYPLLAVPSRFDTGSPGRLLGRAYGIWFGLSLAFGFWWQARFSNAVPDRPQRWFHKQLAKYLLLMALALLYFQLSQGNNPFSREPISGEVFSTGLALLAMLPFAALLEMVYRYNFLNIGRQRNLVYAVSVTFLALFYLALVRRAAAWLEPLVPPEATAAILLFVLVVFIEPLQRVLGRRLRETAQREMDRVQHVTAEIQQEARQGSLAGLVQFIGRRIREEFELSEAHLALADRAGNSEGHTYSDFSDNIGFPIGQADRALGVLEVKPHGAGLSGETRAALEFLCEQLPGALDLCRLIEEKLHLERELAERERLALVGQMAASISHNLKNPLGSIKTILQVQMESAELPESMRRETKMVLDEIGRLSSKLNQMLQFSRPAVRAGSVAANCDAKAVVVEVATLLRHEAERRGIVLEMEFPGGSLKVAASAEAMSDIASNLLVNALEAASRGGHVSVRMTEDNGGCALVVQDDGPGIPASARGKVLQPFFTTKSQGTGLGLAIVARRVAESDGRLEWDSPVKDGHGTRFRVTLLRAGEGERNAGNEGQEAK
jgi:signal transduction histidine kinase